MAEYTRTNHEIDYKIYGEELQFVEIELDPNETAIAESGAFMMMDDGIQMQTVFGDGSQQQSGLLGKLFSAGKRLLGGRKFIYDCIYKHRAGKEESEFCRTLHRSNHCFGPHETGWPHHCTKRCFSLCGAKV